MRNLFILAIAFISLTACSEAQTESNGVINKVVSASEFKDLAGHENIQLIDVRTASEYNGGKIGDAVNIDFYASDFKAQIDKLDKSKKTLVYCAAGGRSGKADNMMKSMGFKEVYDLKGGYGNWPYK